MKNWIVGFLSVVGVFTLAVVGFFGYITLTMEFEPLPQRPFDQEEWLAFDTLETQRGICPRTEMLDDLSENYLKIGMQRKAVIKILGEGDTKNNRNCIDYSLNHCEADLLSICFNDANLVTSKDAWSW